MMEKILEFWFGDVLDGAPMNAEKGRLWFGKDETVDQQINADFGDLLQRAGAGEFDSWAETAEGALALLVLLDQFSRNIYRGDPRSFSFDIRALSIAEQAIEAGLDRQLPIIPRAFYYLPLEHSESLVVQDRCVELFEQLLTDASERDRKACASFLDYARQHQVIIDRFGRFPHRNVILGRDSTAEELAFLQQPGSSF